MQAEPSEAAAPNRPARDRVIIIGAGVAGLSCGCYLQMNGIQTEILEAGGVPGGLCTAWHRGPYVFDGCLRWLMGAQAPSAFNQIWTELGALADRRVFPHDELLRIEWPDGQSLPVPADLDDFARRFKQVAPEDSGLIDRLVRDARRCSSLEPPLENPLELMSPLEKMRLGARCLPIIPAILRYKNLPITRYVARYRNQRAREALQILVGNDDISALVLVMLLAFRSRKNTGFVAGGSWDFAMAITDRYRRLGGSLRLNCRVASIQVADGRARAVACADGRSRPAATVVSCADGHTTIFKMLEGRFINRHLRFLYEHCRTFPPLLQVSLGIGTLFPDAPPTLNFPLARPLAVDDHTRHERLEVETFGASSQLCPEGSTLMTVRLQTHYDYWSGLKQDDVNRYRAEKHRIVDEVVAVLEKRFPGMKSKIECFDVATPATFFRYTGNWQGSYEGWLPTPAILGRRIPYTLPGLKNFYMAGHWVVPGGGLPSAALAGRYVAQLICAQFGKKFVPQRP